MFLNVPAMLTDPVELLMSRDAAGAFWGTTTDTPSERLPHREPAVGGSSWSTPFESFGAGCCSDRPQPVS